MKVWQLIFGVLILSSLAHGAESSSQVIFRKIVKECQKDALKGCVRLLEKHKNLDIVSKEYLFYLEGQTFAKVASLPKTKLKTMEKSARRAIEAFDKSRIKSNNGRLIDDIREKQESFFNLIIAKEYELKRYDAVIRMVEDYLSRFQITKPLALMYIRSLMEFKGDRESIHLIRYYADPVFLELIYS